MRIQRTIEWNWTPNKFVWEFFAEKSELNLSDLCWTECYEFGEQCKWKWNDIYLCELLIWMKRKQRAFEWDLAVQHDMKMSDKNRFVFDFWLFALCERRPYRWCVYTAKTADTAQARAIVLCAHTAVCHATTKWNMFVSTVKCTGGTNWDFTWEISF